MNNALRNWFVYLSQFKIQFYFTYGLDMLAIWGIECSWKSRNMKLKLWYIESKLHIFICYIHTPGNLAHRFQSFRCQRSSNNCSGRIRMFLARCRYPGTEEHSQAPTDMYADMITNGDVDSTHALVVQTGPCALGTLAGGALPALGTRTLTHNARAAVWWQETESDWTVSSPH